MSKEISNIKSKAQVQALGNKVNRLKQKLNSSSDKKELQKAAEEFESIFLYQLLKTMRKTIMKSDLLGDGFGGEIFQSMWDEKIAEQAALHGRLGLAEMIVKSLDNSTENNHKELMNHISKMLNSGSVKKVAPDIRPAGMDKLKPYENIINEVSQEVKINPRLVKAVILAESAGKQDAVSPKGAKGLMQLMDSTATMLNVRNPFDPYENIRAGSLYLKRLLKQFRGDLKLALAAYNAGPGNVKKYGTIPPFKETQTYVKKVLSYFKALQITQL